MGEYPALNVSRQVDEYERQRLTDPDMLCRDVGLAMAEATMQYFPRALAVSMALDSEAVREAWGRRLIAELEDAGYAVAFRGRKGGRL